MFDKGSQPLIDAVNEIIHSHIEMDKSKPVRPATDPQKMTSELELPICGKAHDIEQTVSLLKNVLAATPSTTSTRFANQLFGGRDTASTLGEMAAAIANTPMYTFKSGGPQILIEKEVIRKMSQLAGYSSHDGIFTPGGSLSNMAAMIIARNEAVAGLRENGLITKKMIIYSSAEAHYSVKKAAGMIGVGRNNVRGIPVDQDGKMKASKLETSIEQDLKEGHIPTMLNITAGTTVQGAFDNINELSIIARKYNIWVHVDGAFGGSLLLSKKHKEKFKGLEHADSFTWDAHKAMGAPLTSSVLLTKEKGMCKKHFDESADYLFQMNEDADLNPGHSSLQCGRRNDALKVWTAWKHHGDQGLELRIEKLLNLAQSFAQKVTDTPQWHLCKLPEYLNVCFYVDGVDTEKLCAELALQKKLKVSYGIVDGRTIVRMVFLNPDLNENELDSIIADIKEVAQSL